MTIEEKIAACAKEIAERSYMSDQFGVPILAEIIRKHFGASDSEPHVWTHPAEDCDVEGCTHRTVRTCEQSEKEKQFLRDRLDRMRERLYKIAPDEARKDWNRIVTAAGLPELTEPAAKGLP